jgi:hypothetical protein
MQKENPEKLGVKVDLLPCPFCGGQAILDTAEFEYIPELEAGLRDSHIIFCSNARCDINPCVSGSNVEGLIKIWNRRNRPCKVIADSLIQAHMLSVPVTITLEEREACMNLPELGWITKI